MSPIGAEKILSKTMRQWNQTTNEEGIYQSEKPRKCEKQVLPDRRAAHNSNRGMVKDFTGATLVFAATIETKIHLHVELEDKSQRKEL